jgi:prepilin-type N-terminal cleavage/methylation domain-containing protein
VVSVRSRFGRLRSDTGFSLTELLVVLGIMGVVLAGAYSLSLLTNRTADVSAAQAAFASEIGNPLELGEKYLQQNSGLEEWDDYRLVCFTDADLNGYSERVILEAHDDGQLTLDVWNTDLERHNTNQQIHYVMSEHNSNVAEGVPLFTYLDGDGVEVDSYDSRASDTRNIRMEVLLDMDEWDFRDDRVIHFRNRS